MNYFDEINQSLLELHNNITGRKDTIEDVLFRVSLMDFSNEKFDYKTYGDF